MPNHKGRRPGTRRVRIWVRGKSHEWIFEGSKADADKFEARKRIELEANDHQTRVAPRFSELCVEKYAPFGRANLTKATWRARSNIIASLSLFFGERRMDRFEAGDVEAYKTHRLTESKLRPISLNTELRTLKIIFRWAAARGYPMKLPPIVLLKEPRGRVKLWTPTEIAKLLDVTRTKAPGLLPMVIFLANTGCRKGEAQAAEWSWVDLPAGMLRIPANEAWKPKSGRAREIPISDACRVVLSAPHRSERWVFPTRDGRRYERFPDALFKEMQKDANVSGGPHVLRHSYASAFLQAVPDLFLLANVLGHSHTRITELYAHLLPEHLDRARNAVNIGPPLKKTGAATGAKASRKR